MYARHKERSNPNQTMGECSTHTQRNLASPAGPASLVCSMFPSPALGKWSVPAVFSRPCWVSSLGMPSSSDHSLSSCRWFSTCDGWVDFPTYLVPWPSVSEAKFETNFLCKRRQHTATADAGKQLAPCVIRQTMLASPCEASRPQPLPKERNVSQCHNHARKHARRPCDVALKYPLSMG